MQRVYDAQLEMLRQTPICLPKLSKKFASSLDVTVHIYLRLIAKPATSPTATPATNVTATVAIGFR